MRLFLSLPMISVPTCLDFCGSINPQESCPRTACLFTSLTLFAFTCRENLSWPLLRSRQLIPVASLFVRKAITSVHLEPSLPWIYSHVWPFEQNRTISALESEMVFQGVQADLRSPPILTWDVIFPLQKQSAFCINLYSSWIFVIWPI